MLTTKHYTFNLCKFGTNSALNVIDKSAFISNTYQLYKENDQLYLYIYGGNYKAKELMTYLLDNNLATVKQITKEDKFSLEIPYTTHNDTYFTYIAFIFQLTPVMMLHLC